MLHTPRTTGTTPLFAGFELGGTKCIATLATGPEHIVDQRSVATEAPQTTLSALAAVLADWRRDRDVAAIGIGSFGPIALDPAAPDHGRMRATTKHGWPGADILGALSGGTGLPVALDTDVNGAARAEMLWGTGVGIDDFAYVTVGTGVGVGLYVNGRPTRGIGHSEIGHLRVPRLADDGGPSGCPLHHDCVEGLAAGPGIQAALEGLPVEEANPDHPVWNRVAAALAAMSHALLCTTGPARIAIGGGVLTRQPHLLARIEPAMRRSLAGYLALPDAPIIVAPTLGAQAGPLGAVALAQDAWVASIDA